MNFVSTSYGAGLDFDQLKLFGILDYSEPTGSFDTLQQKIIHCTLTEHIENVYR